MELVLITGLSGSGKSVALHVLEDAGYYCVDNLPATLLPQLVTQLQAEDYGLVAVAVDMRGGASLAALPKQLRNIATGGSVNPRVIFLDASDEVLVERAAHPRNGQRPIFRPGDELRDQRIVEDRDVEAGGRAAVVADAGAGRHAQLLDPSG